MESSQASYNETNSGLNINNGLAKNAYNLPEINSYNVSNTTNSQIPVATKNKEPEPGIFGRFANYLKSFWEIEEEEYIDAHGFVSKRPKTKIPLRNKKDKDNNKVQAEGANSLNYATQHSAFGRIFL